MLVERVQDDDALLDALHVKVVDGLDVVVEQRAEGRDDVLGHRSWKNIPRAQRDDAVGIVAISEGAA